MWRNDLNTQNGKRLNQKTSARIISVGLCGVAFSLVNVLSAQIAVGAGDPAVAAADVATTAAATATDAAATTANDAVQATQDAAQATQDAATGAVQEVAQDAAAMEPAGVPMDQTVPVVDSTIPDTTSSFEISEVRQNDDANYPSKYYTPAPREGNGSYLKTWIAGAVTLGSAVSALAFGLSASDLNEELDLICNRQETANQFPNGCFQEDLDRVDRRALTSDVLWGVAGVGAIVTGVMFYLEHRDATQGGSMSSYATSKNLTVSPVMGVGTYGLGATLRY